MYTNVVSHEDVEALMNDHSLFRFDELQSRVAKHIFPRAVNAEDRVVISDVMRARVTAAAVEERVHDDVGHRNVLMLTAFTDDYSIGRLVDTVNRAYAERHGYQYVTRVLPYEDMLVAIGPHKKHCTWYKVLLMNQLLNDEAFLQQHQVQYLMWIDADALVINPEVRVEDVIQRGGGRDLIVAENMHAGCLVNAGVLLVRVSAWSRQLWREVWECDKYDDVFFYEQSALLRRLRAKREGLELLPSGVPFHSYLPGARKGPKLYAHVAVLPHLELNTNSGWVQVEDERVKKHRGRRFERAKRRMRARGSDAIGSLQSVDDLVVGAPGAAEGEGTNTDDGDGGGGDDGGDTDAAAYAQYLSGLQPPLYIFHAAGHCAKLEALRGAHLHCTALHCTGFRFISPHPSSPACRHHVGMMERHGLPVPQEFLDQERFKLQRDMKKLKNEGLAAVLKGGAGADEKGVGISSST